MSRPLALALAALIGLGCGRGEGDVVVFAAASTGDVVREVASGESKDEVVVSVGASSTLARQVRQGAPADVLVLADPSWADWLEEEGVPIVERATLAQGRLVWVEAPGTPPRGSIPEAAQHVRRLALGDPGHVPVGRYAREALVALGVWAEVSDRVIPQADVRAALAAVETGAADAAIVYASDARLSSRVVVTAEVPSLRPIRFEGVLLAPRGRPLFDALRADEGAWRAHGFVAP